jgi:hypothetical protein
VAIYPHEAVRSALDEFSWNFIFQYFSKIYLENSSLIKIRQESRGTLHEDLGPFMVISFWILLKMRNVSDKFVGKTITHILYSITFSRKSCRL